MAYYFPAKDLIGWTCFKPNLENAIDSACNTYKKYQ
tara:strand:- start:187 stop:294 length:108 start_codon:yes stop_codon:yes gene_type:complete